MSLVLHQFRKDARQFRILLAIWFALLLLDLAVNLGWVGQVVYHQNHGFDQATNTWTNWLPIILWVLTGVVPSLVVLTDSPARREGFLATRPLPRRDLFLAKLIFILVLVVTPWTLQELVHLVLRGMPAWVVTKGTLERLMFAVPATLACAAYAALWSGYARWARAVAVTAIGAYLLLIISALLSEFVSHKPIFLENLNLTRGLAGAYELVLALMIVAVWHSRAYRGALARWSFLGLVALSYFLTTSWWPWNFFKLHPENQPAAQSIMAGSNFEIPRQGLGLQQVQDTDNGGQSYFNISLSPEINSLPTNDVIEWNGTKASLTDVTGRAIHGGIGQWAGIFGGSWWNNSYQIPDYVAWSSEFPPDIMFHANGFYTGNAEVNAVYTHFDLPSSHEELAASLTLRAGFDARVYQWHKIADLPLTPGATSADEFGVWKYLANQNANVNAQNTQLYLYMQRSQIELATADNSRCSSTENGPLTRMAFMLYDPLRHLAWLPEQPFWNNATRGAHTALPQYRAFIEFSRQKAFTTEELARSRLIIFEKSWLGSVPETWQSPTFSIMDKLQPAFSGAAANEDPMPNTECNRRIAALKAPAPDAPRREVSLYLLDFLRLVDARRNAFQLDDPPTRQLAAYVPDHLDLLLDGLPAMDNPAKSIVLNAIKLGATDAQKPAIIAALQREPDLASVLLARGWVNDARPEIYQLLQSSRPLPLDALRAIASFHDPQTYPRLLEEFKASPSEEADELLETLPGLRPRLDAIVAQAWHNQSLVWRRFGYQMFDDEFDLALHHGQTSALQRAYLAINTPELDLSGVDYSLADTLSRGILMPDLKPENRQEKDAVFGWMRKHTMQDFVFNPALHQFVLQPGRELTANNP